MTSSTLTDLVIGLAVIAYLCSRQLVWRPVDPARMWRFPLILGAVGAVSLGRHGTSIHSADVLVMGLSALAALVSGTLMGTIARFRPSPADPNLVETRTGWAGVALWLALIVVRVGLDVVGHRMGSDLAVSTGSILLVLACNRFARALVVLARRPGHGFALAGR